MAKPPPEALRPTAQEGSGFVGRQDAEAAAIDRTARRFQPVGSIRPRYRETLPLLLPKRRESDGDRNLTP